MNPIIYDHRDEILRLARKHVAQNVRLFGSAARGDDRVDSDLDLLVEMGKDRSLIDHVALKQDLEELLRREIDVVTEQSLYPRLRDWVLRKAIALE